MKITLEIDMNNERDTQALISAIQELLKNIQNAESVKSPKDNIGEMQLTKTFGKAGYIAVDLDNIWTRNRKYKLHDDSGWIQLRFVNSHYLIIEEWRDKVKDISEEK